MPEHSAFDPLTLPESNATSYPEPYRAANRMRWNRRLSDHANLTNFGVNLTRIVPGGQSSHRHAHSRQDEFIYVLRGDVELETNAGMEHLRAGMCAGFPAGSDNAHRFVNRSAEDVLLLVVGDRTAGDEVSYPDIDMHARMEPGGRYRFMRKDGTSF
ncbi:MAG: cupin domain-containing protein [Rhodospirillales bacterium]|nr:cupin domain-containing protein [Rhodospirillales bacterium]